MPKFRGKYDKETSKLLLEALDDAKAKKQVTAERLTELSPEGTDKKLSTEEHLEYIRLSTDYSRYEAMETKAQTEYDDYELRNPETIQATRVQNDMYSLFDRYLRYPGDSKDILASDDFTEYAVSREKSIANASEWGFNLVANPAQLVGADGMPLFNTADAIRSDNASGQEAQQETVTPSLIQRLAQYGGMAQSCFNFSSADGTDLVILQADDSTQRGFAMDEQGADAAKLQPGNIDRIILKMITWNSGYVNITREMIQDAVFNVVMWVERLLLRRLGRAFNRDATRGRNVGQTNNLDTRIDGLLNVARTAANNTAMSAAIAYGEIIDLIYEVDPAYLMGGEMGEGGFMDTIQVGSMMTSGIIGFMIAHKMEQALTKMVDGDSRPLWVPSIREGQPNMIAGYPYRKNFDLEAPAAGKKSMLFGNFDHYAIRQALEMEVHRFWDSGTAGANEVRCLGFMRKTGKHVGPTDANDKSDAIVALQQG